MFRPKIFGTVKASVSPHFLAALPPTVDRMILMENVAKKTGLILSMSDSNILFSGSFKKITELHTYFSNYLDEWFGPKSSLIKGLNQEEGSASLNCANNGDVSSNLTPPSSLDDNTMELFPPFHLTSDQNMTRQTIKRSNEKDLDELDRLCRLLRLDEAQPPLPSSSHSCLKPPFKVPEASTTAPAQTSPLFTPGFLKEPAIRAECYSSYKFCPFCPFKTERLSHFMSHAMKHMKTLLESAKRGCGELAISRLNWFCSLIPTDETEPSKPAPVQPSTSYAQSSTLFSSPVMCGSLGEQVRQHRTEDGSPNGYWSQCSLETNRICCSRKHFAHTDGLLEMYKCNYCNFKSIRRRRLRQHQLFHHGVDQFGRTVLGLDTLDKYCTRVKRTKSVEITQKEKLEKEKRQHQKKLRAKIQCSECDYESRRLSRLVRHERKVHGMKLKDKLGQRSAGGRPTATATTVTSTSHDTAVWVTAATASISATASVSTAAAPTAMMHV